MKSGQSTHGYGKTKMLVLEYKDKGLTVSEIAKKVGVSYSAVYNVGRRAGFKIKNSSRRWHGEVKSIVLTEHFDNNLTPMQIVRKHGISKNSVYYVYRYCGFKYHK